MPRQPRKLQIRFASEEEFCREYASNIANGGIFVPTDEAFAINDSVCVVIDLSYCRKKVALDGEVVHFVPPELASSGATPGAAVQFSESTRELRDRFEPIVGELAGGNERAASVGRRAAPRAAVRIKARLGIEGRGWIDGRTRNLSTSGMLVSIDGKPVPVGESMRIAISHPKTGERIKLGGRVVRHVEGGDGVVAMGMEFQIPIAREPELHAFLNEIKATEHSRRLGGISGPIAEIGIDSLLQMFGNSASRGTLAVMKNGVDGVIAFESGLLRVARVGTLEGIEALSEMLGWRDGSFEFHANTDSDAQGAAPLPLEGAILEALRQLDERRSGATPTNELPGAAEFQDPEETANFDAAFSEDADLEGAFAEDALAEDPFADDPIDEEDEAEEEVVDDVGGDDDAEIGEFILDRADVDSQPELGAMKLISPDVVLRVDSERADGFRAELTKSEEAVLDLALAGTNVARIVQIIPEPEAEIYAVIDGLVDRGLVWVDD